MPDGKPGDGKTSPFGNGQGATSAMGSASGANDFLTNPEGNGSKSGGRDFTKESRSQSEAKPEVVPNPQEIPVGNGGKDLKADPGSVSSSVSGTAAGVDGAHKPFRVK